MLKSQGSQEKTNKNNKKRVLIIEDMNEMRSMLKAIIISLGYSKEKIDVEASGQSAIKLIMDNYYDVILSDYNLGGDINGQTILETVRKSYKLDQSTTFIMITADVSYNCVINILEYEPDSYIIKPFTKSDFVHRFKRIQKRKEIFNELNNAKKNRKYEEMNLHAKKVMKLHPHLKKQCLKSIGESLLLQKKYYEAKLHYLSVLEQDSEVCWAKYGTAICEIKLGNVFIAMQYLTDLTEFNKTFLSAYDALSELQIKLGRYEEAQSTLLDLIKLSPYSLKRVERLGTLSFKVKDWENVERAYSRIIYLTRDTSKEKINYYYSHLQSINYLIDKGEISPKLTEKFKRSLTKLRSLGKENPTVISNSYRVEIHQYLGRNYKSEAIKSWQKWDELMKKGHASPVKESQRIDIKNRLGLY